MPVTDIVDPYAAGKANAHFCVRALERHGLILKNQEITEIIRQILKREAEFLKWSDGQGHRAFYRINIFDEPYIVLYEFEINALITIYYNSWLKLKDGEWIPNMKYRKGRRMGNEKW